MKDIHTERASRMFNVREEDVTPEQRQKAKTKNYEEAYTTPSSSTVLLGGMRIGKNAMIQSANAANWSKKYTEMIKDHTEDTQAFDVITIEASKIYGVAEEDVTFAMRAHVKQLMFPILYATKDGIYRQ